MKPITAKLAASAALCITASFAHGYWPAIFHSPSNGASFTTAMETDSKGNLYIAGGVSGNGSGRDVLLVKFNQYGVFQWSQTFGGTNDDEYAVGLAIDQGDNPYMLASSNDGIHTNFLTIKYAKNGALAWREFLIGGNSSDDTPLAIKACVGGGAVVTGTTASGSSGADLLTARYTSNGNLVFSKTYGKANANDIASDVAVDSTGNIYVSGRVDNGASNGYDYGLVKYSSTGDFLWVRKLNGVTNGYDAAAKVLVDSENDVVVTGRSDTNQGFYTILTAKYNRDGDKLWESKTGTANHNVVPLDMKIDQFNSIVVAGNSSDNDGSEFYVTKLDSAGNKQWAKIYAGDNSGMSYNSLSGVEVDPAGNVNVGGMYEDFTTGNYYYVMVRYSSSGQRNWVRIDSLGVGQTYAAATAMDQQTGRVYLGGRAFNSATSTYDLYTTKYQ